MKAKQPLEFKVDREKNRLVSLQLVAYDRRTGQTLTILIVVMAIILAAILSLPWQQTSFGTGRVIAFSPNERPQELSAPVDGRIRKWHVTEGSKVKEGDLLLEISDNDPEILDRIRQERDGLLKRLEAAGSASKVSRNNVKRQEQLFKEGLASERAVEQAQIDFARFITDEANASVELARIDLRLARQLTQTVVATTEGTILRILQPEGSPLVKQGQPVAVLVPNTSERAVEIIVSGNDVPLISEESTVRIIFEGWPAIQFSGSSTVHVGTFAGRVALIDSSDNGQGLFRVVVVPAAGESWPEARYIRQGARANGWVLLGVVPLYYELWRRFNGFPPSIEDGKQTQKTSPQPVVIKKK